MNVESLIQKCINTCWVSLLSLFTIMPVQATQSTEYDQPVQTLFITNTVSPQDQGTFQTILEPSFLVARDQSNLLSFPITVDVGLTDKWQFGLTSYGYEFNHPTMGHNTNGIGDSGAYTQYSFIDLADTYYSMALGLTYIYPLSKMSNDLSEGLALYSPYLILTQDFPRFHDAQIFMQLEFTVPQRIKMNPGPPVNPPICTSGSINFGFYIPFSDDHWIVSSEWSWTSNDNNDATGANTFYWVPGLIYNFNTAWEVGVAPELGFTQESYRYGGLAFLSVTAG